MLASLRPARDRTQIQHYSSSSTSFRSQTTPLDLPGFFLHRLLAHGSILHSSKKKNPVEYTNYLLIISWSFITSPTRTVSCRHTSHITNIGYHPDRGWGHTHTEHKTISISDLALNFGHLKKDCKIIILTFLLPTPRTMWVIADICNV